MYIQKDVELKEGLVNCPALKDGAYKRVQVD